MRLDATAAPAPFDFRMLPDEPLIPDVQVPVPIDEMAVTNEPAEQEAPLRLRLTVDPVLLSPVLVALKNGLHVAVAAPFNDVTACPLVHDVPAYDVVSELPPVE